MINDITLRVNPAQAANEDKLKAIAAAQMEIAASEVNDIRIIRRSIDARKAQIKIDLLIRVATGSDKCIAPTFEPYSFPKLSESAPRIVIVGAGPAGLFAALKAIELGVRPIVLERGKDVDSRRIDIANISREGKINPGSNYCFGEGGAGAYSDGKLYTRSKKRGNVEEVLRLLVQHGASPDILIDAHPHIGSDKLPHVIRNIRQTIIQSGAEVRFEAKADALIIKDGAVRGVRIGDEDILADAVILATGHSAHDTFREIHSEGVELSAKGIAVGVRLEHPQKLIDEIQYHSKEGRGKYLPAAEYSFVTQVEGRGVYSFCMCPGGVIVPAGSDERELVVNGMSASARSGAKANSGMVVEIHPEDFPEYNVHGPLSMLALQEDLEKKIFEASNKSIKAPAQRMKDFVHGRISGTLPPSTYAPGVWSADFNQLLPSFISRRLKKGFEDFGRKARGFLTNEAVMIGLESRTSSPVRVVRNPITLESVNVARLYPAGEGAGYAGGIVSAAIDGIRCVESFVKNREKDDN